MKSTSIKDNNEVSLNIGFVSLGCDKNRVDTENIITTLSKYSNISFVGDKTQADVIIVNTCAFLHSARQEARQTIEEMGQLKENKLKLLLVVGCLPLLEKEKVLKDFPFVDKILVPEEYKDIDKVIFNLLKVKNQIKKDEENGRILTTPMHYAYLKIADGCNNRCAYCKIPFIRGNYKSLPMEDILKEATSLTNKGVKELILVAQDITRYGMDLYKEFKLKELLNNLLKIKKLSWIRLLYCYPDMIDDELISNIKENPKVVKYIDIPLQHISNNVLKLMKRRETKESVCALIEKLRKEMPEIKIRTTFMVGFPGETNKDFNELCKFLKEYKLDNVGFFKYSREKGTKSYDMPNQVDESIKDKRLKKVQQIQEKIAEKNNKKLIGTTLKVLCDSYVPEHKFYVGRPYFSAPEIDFEILFSSFKKITNGSFVDVKIVDFKEGYFIGEVEYEFTE